MMHQRQLANDVRAQNNGHVTTQRLGSRQDIFYTTQGARMSGDRQTVHSIKLKEE